jgi:hypothetical protein
MIVCNFCSSEFPTEQSLLYHQKHTKYCISIQYLSSRLQESIHNTLQQLENKLTQLTNNYDQLKLNYARLEETTNQQIIDLKLLLYTHLPDQTLPISFKRFQKLFCEINPYGYIFR